MAKLGCMFDAVWTARKHNPEELGAIVGQSKGFRTCDFAIDRPRRTSKSGGLYETIPRFCHIWPHSRSDVAFFL